jgi:hypothetical protein
LYPFHSQWVDQAWKAGFLVLQLVPHMSHFLALLLLLVVLPSKKKETHQLKIIKETKLTFSIIDSNTEIESHCK